MQGHVTGVATFHQGVLLDFPQQIPFKNNIHMSIKQGIDENVTMFNVCDA